MFERRLNVFKATGGFLLNSMFRELDQTGFVYLFPEASFLFGKEVEAYMHEAHARRGEAHLIELRGRANGGMFQPADIPRDRELMDWFDQQHTVGVMNVLAPYLDFSEWR